jgi:hypothetical protein
MIVLLDTEKQTLTLYGKKGMVEIPFTQAASMYDYLQSDNVLYITNAMEVNASEILKVIKSMGVVIQDDIVQETGVKYLHAPGEASVYIEEHLQFKGKYDCKMIDANLTQLIEGSPLLQNLIRNKKIEIIGERKRASLARQYKQVQNHQVQQQQNADAALDNMIIQGSVADFDGNLPSVAGHESAIVVDIDRGGRIGTGAGGVGPSFNTMSELMDNIDGLDG